MTSNNWPTSAELLIVKESKKQKDKARITSITKAYGSHRNLTKWQANIELLPSVFAQPLKGDIDLLSPNCSEIFFA